MSGTRTIADMERDSLALLIGWQIEREERAASAPRPACSAAEALAGLSAAIGLAIAGARP